MLKMVIPAAMAISIAMPIQMSYAQPAAPPAPPAEKTEAMVVIRPAHLLMVGAGIVGGVVVGEALFSTDLGMVVGGVLGGYLTHVWYSGRQIELHMANAPKS